jgi:acetyl-CoA C-acetyltransferase
MKRALVIGMEKIDGLATSQVAATLIKCSDVKEEGTDPAGIAGIFGGVAAQYFERFGHQSGALAAI